MTMAISATFKYSDRPWRSIAKLEEKQVKGAAHMCETLATTRGETVAAP